MKKSLILALFTGLLFGVSLNGNAEETQENQEEFTKPVYFELGYNAGSFDDVKLTGSYGFSATAMPWKLYKALFVGIHFSQYFNYGIVDSKSASLTTRLGPSFGYMITPRITIALPVAVGFQYIHESIWSLMWSPSIYFDVYKNFGIYAGPLFTKTFKDGAGVDCGFRAGLSWHF